MYNCWPYTNLHELNLDWVLKKMQELQTTVNNFDVDLKSYVDTWLADHPEYVTTVMDGAITKPKLADSLYSELRPRYINVKLYGAAGDGVTDDTASIKAAFSAAKSENLALFFPEGTYKTTDTIIIDAPIEIFGNGEASRIQNEFGTVFQAGTYIYTRDDFDSDWTYYINIHDLSIRALNSCIYCRACSRSRFYNLWLSGYGSENRGITVGAYSHWNVFHNLIISGAHTGIDVTGEGANSNYNATGNLYTNISIAGGLYYGIRFSGRTFGDVVIANITGVINNPSSGILIEIDGTAADSFYHSRLSVNGLDIDGDAYAVARVRSCYDVRIENYVVGGGVEHQHPLIFGLEMPEVLNKSVPAASTIDLDPYDFVELTGTGTITTINNGYEGREIILLPRNAGISIGTGGNIQTAKTLDTSICYKLIYYKQFWWFID